MELTADGDGGQVRDPEPGQVVDVLRSLRPGGPEFAILAQDEQHYIQTHVIDVDEFILEYREGSGAQHYAVRNTVVPHQVEQVFLSYLAGEIGWQTMVEWRRDRRFGR